MKKQFYRILCCILCLSCLLSMTACRKADDDCVDGQCDIPQFDTNGNQVYAIVSPVGYNDVEMLVAANAGFVPENGSKEALAVAKYVTRSNNNGCIAHAIEILDEIYSLRSNDE